MITCMTPVLEEKAMDFFDVLPVFKKNIDALSEEELNGRYRKAFLSMRSRVLMDAHAFLMKIISQELVFKNKEDMERVGSDLQGEWNEILNREEKDGLYDRLSDILFHRCSVRDYLRECLRLSELLRAGCYRDYWVSHCDCEGGLCYNDIIQMWWRGGVWRSIDGRTCKSSMPPTQEGCHALHLCEMGDLNRLCGIAA